MSQAAKPRSIARYLPILHWLPHYQRAWLPADLMASLAIVALLIPEGMAYAQLAGMPPQTVFYVAPVGLILYALFGSSRQLVVAPTSPIALMSAATIGGLALAGTSDYFALTSMLALLAGIIAVVLGLLKLGRIASFFSESVLTGFVIGLALVIAIKQLPKIFGIEAGAEGFFVKLWEILLHLPQTHLPTFAVGGTTLLLMYIVDRRFHRFPAALVALVYSILVSTLFGLEGRGVEIVGAIPSGLALPKFPAVPWQDIGMLLTGAFALTLVSFAQSIGPAQNLARKHGYAIDPNNELIGLGMASVGAGLFQGFAVSSSLSKTAAADAAGANTELAAIFSAGITIVVALFLTPLFYALPEAALGAIVIIAISGMLNFREMGRLWRLRRIDFVLALVALLGVLLFDVLPGLAIAVVLSLLVLVYQTSKPTYSVLGRIPNRLDFADTLLNPDAKPLPGLLIIRPNQPIYFANAGVLRQAVVAHAKAATPLARTLILDISLTHTLDIPSVDMLRQLQEELAQQQIRLVLSEVRAPVRALLAKSGVAVTLGPENIYHKTFPAVMAFLAADEQNGMAQEVQLLAETLQRMVQVVEQRAQTRDKLDDLLAMINRQIEEQRKDDREDNADAANPAVAL
jgi:high affinity sulfate transporter 1